MIDTETKKYLENAFKDMIGLYKESHEIVRVKVVDMRIDDWGVRFTLMMLDEIQAIDETELVYYKNPSQVGRTFEFSGAWDISSYSAYTFHVAYVNGELNCKEKSMEMFQNFESDLYALWRG